MEKLSDKKIVDSWRKNATPWIKAVREGEIESRLLVTNEAIINAVIDAKPNNVLDIGCGEGWLVRALEDAGINAVGLDIVPELITSAQSEGSGRFMCLAFDDVSYQTVEEKFDAIVCNFSLLGNESVTHVFQQSRSLLNKGGSLIVQTVHPQIGCGDSRYEDGWREGSWQGFSEDFCDPAPWYFRTIASWQRLFKESGFAPPDITEPLHPETRKPASVIFSATVIT